MDGLTKLTMNPCNVRSCKTQIHRCLPALGGGVSSGEPSEASDDEVEEPPDTPSSGSEWQTVTKGNKENWIIIPDRIPPPRASCGNFELTHVVGMADETLGNGGATRDYRSDDSDNASDVVLLDNISKLWNDSPNGNPRCPDPK